MPEVKVPEPNMNAQVSADVAGIRCNPSIGWCPYEGMTCIGRYVQTVDESNEIWQKLVQNDPTLNEDQESFWCVDEPTLEDGMKWNGKFNEKFGV